MTIVPLVPQAKPIWVDGIVVGAASVSFVMKALYQF
jgi:hypothetical protein